MLNIRELSAAVTARAIYDAAAAMRTMTQPLTRGCVLAGLAVCVACVIRILLRPVLGSASPFLLFTPAVAISALFGGTVPGALATALSTVLGSQLFLADVGEPVIERWDRIGLFVLVGVVITLSSTKLRRSREQVSESLWREQKARAIAEAADREKDDFLTLVSHELRTPLSVVLGWIAAIRHQPSNVDELNRALDAVDRNTRVMSRLVEDVLEWSRLATGTLRLDRQLIALGLVVRAAIDEVRPRLESDGLRCLVSIPEDDCYVLADSVRLQQVFTNLVSNAVKFTPRGGQISITMTITDAHAKVTVSDNGCGISHELLPHVFEMYRQGLERPHQSQPGLGVGLSIVHDLVEKHGGMVTVESDGHGLGSAFTVILPLPGRGQPVSGNHQQQVFLPSINVHPS
jgi:signal transduction histidine kinase